jgi:hypothetical protein
MGSVGTRPANLGRGGANETRTVVHGRLPYAAQLTWEWSSPRPRSATNLGMVAAEWSRPGMVGAAAGATNLGMVVAQLTWEWLR